MVLEPVIPDYKQYEIVRILNQLVFHQLLIF